MNKSIKLFHSIDDNTVLEFNVYDEGNYEGQCNRQEVAHALTGFNREELELLSKYYDAIDQPAIADSCHVYELFSESSKWIGHYDNETEVVAGLLKGQLFNEFRDLFMDAIDVPMIMRTIVEEQYNVQRKIDGSINLFSNKQ